MQSGFWNRFLFGTANVKQRTTTSTATVCLAALMAATVGLAADTSAWAQQAQAVATQTQLSAAMDHTAAGSRATFTIHVEPANGDASASGVVTLVDGGLQIGSGILNEDGDAIIEADGLPPGPHSVHALYSGSGKLRGSVSPVAEVSAEATSAAGFTATASPTALSVAQGDTATTTITLTPQNGFSEYVSLSCTNLPPDSTCTFLPVNVLVSGTKPSTAVLSIETYAPTGPDASLRRHAPMVLAFLFPGILAIAGIGMRRRSWQSAALVLIVLAGFGSMSGCSQRYHYLNRPPVASPGTGLGSTNIIIEAQAVSGVIVTTEEINNVVLTVTAP